MHLSVKCKVRCSASFSLVDETLGASPRNMRRTHPHFEHIEETSRCWSGDGGRAYNNLLQSIVARNRLVSLLTLCTDDLQGSVSGRFDCPLPGSKGEVPGMRLKSLCRSEHSGAELEQHTELLSIKDLDQVLLIPAAIARSLCCSGTSLASRARYLVFRGNGTGPRLDLDQHAYVLEKSVSGVSTACKIRYQWLKCILPSSKLH